MERNRNLVAWAALIMAGLALVVAFAGRGPFGGWERMAVPAAPVAPAAPIPPGFEDDLREERERFRADAERFRAEGGRFFGQQGPMHRFGHDGPRHGFGGWFFGPLMLLKGLAQLAALGLLAWLLLRLFNQRRNPPAAPAVPTTPAGHDPRVE